MKPIVEKVLASGLIDKHMAQYLEKMQLIPDGASEQVREDALKGATQDQLRSLAEDLATEVEKEHRIRETALDLERIRWPVLVNIVQPTIGNGPQCLHAKVPAVMDRMGRYYFQVDEVDEDWFAPGLIIERISAKRDVVRGIITQSQLLYIGESPVCWQVSIA